jgi:hypothetical protein
MTSKNAVLTSILTFFRQKLCRGATLPSSPLFRHERNPCADSSEWEYPITRNIFLVLADEMMLTVPYGQFTGCTGIFADFFPPWDSCIFAITNQTRKGILTLIDVQMALVEQSAVGKHWNWRFDCRLVNYASIVSMETHLIQLNR